LQYIYLERKLLHPHSPLTWLFLLVAKCVVRMNLYVSFFYYSPTNYIIDLNCLHFIFSFIHVCLLLPATQFFFRAWKKNINPSKTSCHMFQIFWRKMCCYISSFFGWFFLCVQIKNEMFLWINHNRVKNFSIKYRQ